MVRAVWSQPPPGLAGTKICNCGASCASAAASGIPARTAVAAVPINNSRLLSMVSPPDRGTSSVPDNGPDCVAHSSSSMSLRHGACRDHRRETQKCHLENPPAALGMTPRISGESLRLFGREGNPSTPGTERRGRGDRQMFSRLASWWRSGGQISARAYRSATRRYSVGIRPELARSVIFTDQIVRVAVADCAALQENCRLPCLVIFASLNKLLNKSTAVRRRCLVPRRSGVEGS